MGGPGEGLQVFNVNQIVFKAKKGDGCLLVYRLVISLKKNDTFQYSKARDLESLSLLYIM